MYSLGVQAALQNWIAAGQNPTRIRTRCLEIQAAEHCNIRCSGCAQNSPFLAPRFPDLITLNEDLSRLAPIFHTERISVVGGEPLLNPQIGELLQTLHASDISDRIVITTNGLLLHRAPDSLWEIADAIEISLYPDTAERVLQHLPSIWPHAWACRTEIHLLPTPKFRRITLTEPIRNSDTVREVFKRCYFKEFTHTLRDGKFYRCAPGSNIPTMVAKASTGAEPPQDAGLLIRGHNDLAAALSEYIHQTTPMPICSFCLGSSGAEFDHAQLDRDQIQRPTPISFQTSMLTPVT